MLKKTIILAFAAASLALASAPKPDMSWAQKNCPNYYHTKNPDLIYTWSITVNAPYGIDSSAISASPNGAIQMDTSNANVVWLYGCYGHAQQLDSFSVPISHTQNCKITGSIIGANGWEQQSHQRQSCAGKVSTSTDPNNDHNLIVN